MWKLKNLYFKSLWISYIFINIHVSTLYLNTNPLINTRPNFKKYVVNSECWISDFSGEELDRCTIISAYSYYHMIILGRYILYIIIFHYGNYFSAWNSYIASMRLHKITSMIILLLWNHEKNFFFNIRQLHAYSILLYIEVFICKKKRTPLHLLSK